MGFWARVPTREIGYVAALVGAAMLVGWVSGRTAVLNEVLRPGWLLTQSVVRSVKGGASYFQDLETLRQENAALTARVVAAEAEQARRSEAAAENTRLRGLLRLASESVPQGVAARVIARAPSTWQQRLVLDRGTADAVGLDSVVLAPQGVVGRVVRVSPHTAVVSLLTDMGQTAGVIDQRSRSPGVLMGQGDPSMTLQYLAPDVDFRIGDLLVTSGYGGIYPKGLPVGRVSRVEQQPNAIVPRITLLLTADLDRLEEVLVLPPTGPRL